MFADENEDYTDLWDVGLNKSHEPTRSKRDPKLEDWFVVYRGTRTVLSGVIVGHPRIPDGRRISTSSVKECRLGEDGNLYLVTKRSKYKLGRQLILENLEASWDVKTICTNRG